MYCFLTSWAKNSSTRGLYSEALMDTAGAAAAGARLETAFAWKERRLVTGTALMKAVMAEGVRGVGGSERWAMSRLLASS